MDRTIKEKEQIEDLGLLMLGEIPIIKNSRNV